MAASLDTEKGTKVVKIKGKEVKDASVVVGSGIVGALVGKKTLSKSGTRKDLITGAGAGAGAVMLSNMKEIRLPEGTELIIKLDEPLIIPKEIKQ